MIKLATMTSVCPDWTLEETIAAMKRYGYTGLEARVEWGHKSGIEADLTSAQRRDIRQRLEDEGLSCCCIATGARLATPDADERAADIEALRKYIDLAMDMGAPYVRTFGGAYATDRDFPAVVEYTAEGYRQIIDQAAAANVTVLFETHDSWCDSSPVAGVLELVDSPNVQALWDLLHPMRRMEKPTTTMEVLGKYTRHTHGHDGRIVGDAIVVCELGGGQFNHAEPLHLLHDAGYDGYFSVEVIHEPGSEHDAEGVLKQYAEEFRRIMADRQ